MGNLNDKINRSEQLLADEERRAMYESAPMDLSGLLAQILRNQVAIMRYLASLTPNADNG